MITASHTQIAEILKTLPIGLYLGDRTPVVYEEYGDSYVNLMNGTIHVSGETVMHGLAHLPSDTDPYEFENAIRAILYHELSHIIMTPKTLKNDSERIINCFEDERIETLLFKYYLGVDFKKMCLAINGWTKDWKPTDARTYFYGIVRFRQGPGKFVRRVADLIHKWKSLRADANDYRVADYRDDVMRFWNDVRNDWNQNRQQRQDEQEQRNQERNQREEQQKQDKQNQQNQKGQQGQQGQQGGSNGQSGEQNKDQQGHGGGNSDQDKQDKQSGDKQQNGGSGSGKDKKDAGDKNAEGGNGSDDADKKDGKDKKSQGNGGKGGKDKQNESSDGKDKDNGGSGKDGDEKDGKDSGNDSQDSGDKGDEKNDQKNGGSNGQDGGNETENGKPAHGKPTRDRNGGNAKEQEKGETGSGEDDDDGEDASGSSGCEEEEDFDSKEIGESVEQGNGKDIDDITRESIALDVKRILGKFHDEKVGRVLERLIIQHNKKRMLRTPMSRGYTGKVGYKDVAVRHDYRWFTRKGVGGENMYGSTHFTLWVDCSGSFYDEIDRINSVVHELNELARRIGREFSFDVVQMTMKNRVVSNTVELTSGGCNGFGPGVEECIRKTRKTGCNNYNVVVWDGDMFSGFSRNERERYLPVLRKAFNNQNTVIVTDGDNEPYTRNYTPNARVKVIHDNYSSHFVDALLELLAQVLV